MLERLRDEVDGGDDAYLDAVVKETLRLRPVIALVLRRLVEPMEIGGRMLPAGVTLAPCIYLLHRRPDVYEEPRAFRPERFLEKPPGTYTWIPFGGGVRRCLGASFAQFEMKVVLRELVARLDIRAARAEPERRVRRAIVFAPERGGEIVVERRRHERAAPRRARRRGKRRGERLGAGKRPAFALRGQRRGSPWVRSVSRAPGGRRACRGLAGR